MSYTYCPGPDFSSTIPITSKTIVEFISALEQFFGPGYAFEPEAITERWCHNDKVAAETILPKPNRFVSF